MWFISAIRRGKQMAKSGDLIWNVVHEADDDNGQPTEWSTRLPNGKFLWIDHEQDGYALYDTENTDAKPISVSKTLNAAMASGRNYSAKFAV